MVLTAKNKYLKRLDGRGLPDFERLTSELTGHPIAWIVNQKYPHMLSEEVVTGLECVHVGKSAKLFIQRWWCNTEHDVHNAFSNHTRLLNV